MVLIKFFWLCLILWTTNAACSNETARDYLDPFDAEDQVFLVETLFTKLNTILNETDKLSQNLVDLNHRLDDLSKRQEDQENRVQIALANFQLDLTKRLDVLDERNASQENQLIESQNWHTILRRQDGSVDFERNWNEYKVGFGDSKGEFFIGLEKLHAMTTYGPTQELLVVLKDFENQTRYAKYDRFRVASETEKYALVELGVYSGDAGDALQHHKGQHFSTPDQDNDDDVGGHCAANFMGGWWFKNCYFCYLTGPYRQASEAQKRGISWNEWKDKDYSLKFVEMMIKAKV